MKGATLRLRALSGAPLDDPDVRGFVVSVVREIAAEAGIVITAVETTGTLLVVTLETDALAAMGLLAELRRRTNVWYEERFKDGPLWGTRRG